MTNDGLTLWHPAFLQLGKTLDECAKKYRGFCCQRYKPKLKTASKSYWGSKLLAGHKVHKGKRKCSLGQLALPIGQCQVSESHELAQVVQKFVQANRGCRFDVRV